MVHGRKGLFNSVYAGATATGGRIPGHRQHDFARGRRHHGARALTRRLLVHRPDHDGRTLRPAVDHAERERRVQRDLEAGRAADRLVRVQLSAADARPSPANPGCFPVWTPTCRITMHYADHRHAPGSHPSVVVGAASRPAGVDPMPTGIVTYPQTCTQLPQPRRPGRPARCSCPPHRSNSTDEVSNEDALQLRAYRQTAVRAATSSRSWTARSCRAR